jgi:hypothetical protein
VAYDVQLLIRSVRCVLLCLGLAVVFWASPARSEEEPRKAARAHYEQGLVLANRGAYEAALREFRSAYEKSPQFAVLYNIGQAEIALGHPLEAIHALSQYLRDGGDQVPLERRRQVEAQIALVESLLAELVVTSSEAGALVSVDGRELGTTPLSQPLRVTTGSHRVSLTFPGVPALSRDVTLSEGERRVLHFERPAPALPKAPDSTLAVAPICPKPEARPPAPAPPPARGTPTAVGYGLVSGGAVLGVTTVLHYAWNQGRYADWSAEQAALAPERGAPGYAARQAENNELAHSIERASAVTVSLAIASGALVATGIVLIVNDAPRAAEKTVLRSPARRRSLVVGSSGANLLVSGEF